jgi:HEAT repeat protein
MTFLLGSPPDEAALVTQEAAIRLLEQALADEDESIRDTATDILAQLRDQ